jgi:probable HAF family extracellular repeat protein
MHTSFLRRTLFISVGFAATGLFSTHLHAQRFTNLQGAGFSATALGVFDNQPVIIGKDLNDDFNVVRWTQATGPEIVATGFSVQDASADATVLVGRAPGESFARPVSVRWTSTEGSTTITPLRDWPSAPDRISADGSTIVGRGNQYGYRWTAETGVVNLGGFPDGGEQGPDGPPTFRISEVSANGSVLVGANTGSLIFEEGETVRWTAETGTVGLGSEFTGNALGVSDDGSVIVGYNWYNSEDLYAVGRQAFRWTSETGLVDLGFLPGGTDSYATAISGNGGLIVGHGNSADDPTGETLFIWTATTGMQNLVEHLTNEYGLGEELDGWNLGTIAGISADGRYIAGNGYAPNGAYAPWLVDLEFAPVPEASTYGVFTAVGLLAFAVFRRRQKNCEGAVGQK